MDYRLLFTQRALNDLAEIIGHIAEEDDDAASRFGNACSTMWTCSLVFPAWEALFENARAFASCSIARFWSTTKSVKISVSWKCFTSVTDHASRQDSSGSDAAWSGSNDFPHPPFLAPYSGLRVISHPGASAPLFQPYTGTKRSTGQRAANRTNT